MTTMTEMPVEARLAQLFGELGVERPHVAALMPLDYRGLIASHSDNIASLCLICPPAIVPGTVQALASRLLVISGESGPAADQVRAAISAGSAVEHVPLTDLALFADFAAEYTDVIGGAMVSFLDAQTERAGVQAMSLPAGEGEIAGISYRVEGEGPPLVLLPLGFAPSQWEPLIPLLSRRYCTITLGGAALGTVSTLELRATGGYLRLFRTLIEDVALRPGESVLDAGCGSGVLDRWLARRTEGRNSITAVDYNRYVLREAATLARRDGTEGTITFCEGDLEDLSFPDASFDVSLSCTVLEEGDADRMIAELVRVTKPGGRVGIIVRSIDIGLWLNMPLRPDLKARLQVPGVMSGAVEKGCADSSLYRRCQTAGLSLISASPQFAETVRGMRGIESMQGFLVSRLTSEEAVEWRDAVSEAEAAGTLFISGPYHCAVGIKPA